MKKVNYYLLMLLIPAFMIAGCGKDNGNDDKQIQLPNQSEGTQTGYADDETTGSSVYFPGDFTFVAQAAWTATVTENPSASASAVALSEGSGKSALSVSWLRLLLNGVETYSGNAGTIKLAMEPNYTGKNRSATITIVSGTEQISISVTQNGKDQQGNVPEKPEARKYA